MAQPSALKPSLPQAGGLFWERGRGTGSTGWVHAHESRAEMLLWPRRPGGPGVQPPAWAPREGPCGQACQGGWALGAPSTRTQPRPACLRRSGVLEGSSKDLSLRRGPCHLAHKAQRG